MLDEFENKASRGIVPQIILTILSEKSQYGYEICKEIERMTDGELVLKQPSLYSSLRRLEAQNLISSLWQESEIGAKRHYYFLSEKGKKYFEENKDSWQLNELINKLPTNELKDGNVEQKDKKKYSVANQETLFNLNTKKDEVKKIIEDDEKDENQSFFQFDLFNQNVKSIKKPSVEIQKVEAYSNKYQKYDNQEAEIEPLRSESEDKTIKDNMKKEIFSQKVNHNKSEALPIIRNVERRDPFDEDNSSSFDINELVEENAAPSALFAEKIDKEENTIPNLFNDKAKDKIDFVPNLLSVEKEKKEENSSTPINDENSSENDIEKEKVEEKLEVNTNEQSESKSKIERENPVRQAVLFESNDYRSVIGKLFSNSQKSDPYEQNKFNTFKEIFPQTNIVNVQEKKEATSEIDKYVESSSKSDIECDDIEMLSNLFNLQGIKIKTHKNVQNKKNIKAYTDRNKLNMVSSWVTSLLMLFEIIFTYLFLHNSGNLVKGQLLFFFLGIALSLSIFLVSTLENLFDRYKLVVIKIDFRKGITLRLLCFIIISVLTFAICLAFGMQGLTQVEYLSFWLLPVLLSTNIIVSYFIYCFLLSHKYFNS